jgi:hypothetical protein
MKIRKINEMSFHEYLESLRCENRDEWSDELEDVLRTPLHWSQIEFKPQTCKERQGKYQCKTLWYMTARAPAEILDAAIGPKNWMERMLKMEPMKNGEWWAHVEIELFPHSRTPVIKDGVGIGDDPKAAFSDAFKRSFFNLSDGARILYYAPKNFWVNAKNFGNSSHIDFNEYDRLREEYKRLVVERYYNKGTGQPKKPSKPMNEWSQEEWVNYFAGFGSVQKMRDAFRRLPRDLQEEQVIIEAAVKAKEKIGG